MAVRLPVGISAVTAALAMLLSGCTQDQQVQTAAASTAGLEYRTDRFGGDYRSTPMPSGGPVACRAACQQHQSCRSFTWVREVVQGPTPVCHLKTRCRVSPNDCCTSGVVRPVTGG